jgi:hypothetical protein
VPTRKRFHCSANSNDSRSQATPFDAPKIAAVKLNHRGSRCSFEAIIEDFNLADPALHKLALIVRAADVKGQESVAA